MGWFAEEFSTSGTDGVGATAGGRPPPAARAGLGRADVPRDRVVAVLLGRGEDEVLVPDVRSGNLDVEEIL